MTQQADTPEPQEGAPVVPEAPAAQDAAGASSVPTAQDAPQAASAAQAASEPAAEVAPEPEPAPGPAASPAGTVPPPPGAAAPTVPVPPASQPKPKPVFAKNCVTAAWEDIKLNPNWLTKTLFLGLLMCVPILNFVVYGYVLNWAREVPFGGRTAMPKEVVTGRNFEVGFYYVVLSLVFGLAAAIVGAVLGWVPLVGWIASVAASLFASMWTVLAGVRMALSKQLGEGFKMSRIWDALKANWPGLLFLTFVPSLVAGVIIFILVMFVMLVLFVGAMPAIASIASIGDASTAAVVTQIVAALAPLGIIGVVLIAAVLYVCMVIEAAVLLLLGRSAGHYVGRYAPAWADEAKVAMGYPVG